MKRKERKHLKEDKFQEAITQIIEYARKYKKEIFMAGIAVAAVVAIFIVIQVINAQNLKRQNVQLYRIRSLSAELTEKPENLQELEKLAGNGKFARLAHIELAKYWLEKGNFAEAQSRLEKVRGKKDLFYYQAQDLLGQTFINQKEYDKAIGIYETIKEENPENYVLDVVIFHLAEAYEGKGEIEKALGLYKRVQEDYPQTYYGNDASSKVKELEQKN
ncbi:MAG: tetratricopeptide repeat protein [Candidatus Aminicenantes bacterium]|nr:tetratricopeptide repeat protein [Candidatus Aminicenantes bacterium]